MAARKAGVKQRAASPRQQQTGQLLAGVVHRTRPVAHAPILLDLTAGGPPAGDEQAP